MLICLLSSFPVCVTIKMQFPIKQFGIYTNYMGICCCFTWQSLRKYMRTIQRPWKQFGIFIKLYGYVEVLLDSPCVCTCVLYKSSCLGNSLEESQTEWVSRGGYVVVLLNNSCVSTCVLCNGSCLRNYLEGSKTAWVGRCFIGQSLRKYMRTI